MQLDDFSSVHVAPLRIKKASKGSLETEDETGARGRYVRDSPTSSTVSSRPKFQSFLRASYSFQPPTSSAHLSMTLPLQTGDLVLVHTIHDNGWADGTLLGTGFRGWIPTNYCEPYDYATMRPLLKALTEFWDIIRYNPENTSGLSSNHDYVLGMVAGVRFLLEKSDCLTRDSASVKEHDLIRRIRKGLLADLSVLVKTSKQIQALAEFRPDASQVDNILDDMLLKAFQVVTRAVAFFDVWSEEVAFTSSRYPVSPAHVSSSSADWPDQKADDVTTDLRPKPSAHRTTGRGLEAIPENTVHQTRARPASVCRPTTLSHRMSHAGGLTRGHGERLASVRLTALYDAFLGVLASFLGSHMQSRSSSELLLTTQQAVKACRRLLEVVEIVVAHDVARSESLQEAKDSMYDRLAELIHATRSVFRPLQSGGEEDMIYMPVEGMQLVQAATACVSGAGRCVAKARVLLEETGDFPLELQSERLGAEASPVGDGRPLSVDPSPSELPTPAVEWSFRPRPESPDTAPTPILDSPTASARTSTTPTPATGTYWLRSHESPSSATSTSTTSSIEPPPDGAEPKNTLARSSARGSESTIVSSARDSGPSFVSRTSTRATSPELSMKPTAKTDLDDSPDGGEDEILEYQYAHELMFSPDSRILGGTLNALIERLTAHDTTPDPCFVSTMFLTFRLFATPQAFAEALSFRFDYVGETPSIAKPVRMRVANVLKGWLESHWRHDCDEPVLPFLVGLVRGRIVPVLASVGKRLMGLIDVVASTHTPAVPRVLSAMGKTNTCSVPLVDPDQPLPPPVVSKSQMNALKTWRAGGPSVTILDFDPLELARQFTLKESAIFCSILPEELLGTEFTKQSSSLAVNVRAMVTLSNDLANLVADSILQQDEARKRAATVKQWIKVAAKCLELHNYDTLTAIMCSVDSSTILRLKRTWDLIGPKTKGLFEELKRVVDVSNNRIVLRQRMQNHVPPCLPFVGMYLTDLTFVDHGNAATRQLKAGDDSVAVINLDKHMKTARIVSDLQRFQIPYRLAEVSELQTWLQDEFVRVRAAGERNFQNHYRRSLVLEPRDQTATPRTTTMGTFASMAGFGPKERFDIMSWTHRDKSPAIGS